MPTDSGTLVRSAVREAIQEDSDLSARAISVGNINFATPLVLDVHQGSKMVQVAVPTSDVTAAEDRQLFKRQVTDAIRLAFALGPT
jgi:hypothetical protein